MRQSIAVRRLAVGWFTLLALCLMVSITALTPWMVPGVRAEGTGDLLTNGGKRALTEFRDTPTAGLYRRTWLRVYAKAGETINMGSSGMGVGSGDIWLWNPNIITNSQMATASIPAPTMKCSTSQSTKGKLTTRAQELAGPLPNSGGYDPCTYTAPEAGVYWIAMLGPTGLYGNSDGTSGTITAPNLTSSQNAGVSMWDITVRAGAVTKPGRVFVDYLAMLAGGNGTTYQQFSTLYAIAADGFKYRIDLRGLDPNGYILYGNSVGFLDPDGKTPLYHDLVATDNTLGTTKGGVKQSPATAKLFFSAPNADLPTTIAPTPQIPSIYNVSFSGSAGGTTASYSVGGQFTYTGNVGGISEVVISRDGVNFDPTYSANRVLRSVTAFGTNVINWDGKDNSGTPFPVSPPSYSYRVSMHAGEYHFPLLDAENSANGGPTLTLLNPIGGTCPYALGCSTAFYDDRPYTTSTNVTVNPSADLVNGKTPPNPLFSNPTTGFDSSTNQRKWGDGSGSGFGNWKGLDLWTYFPSEAIQNTLDVVAQKNQDARIQKSHNAAFVIGQNATYTLKVSNVGSGTINGTVTVNDTLPAGLTYGSATGTGWSCGANGQTVTCTHLNTSGLASGAYLPDITLTVSVGQVAAPSVTNTATVAIVSTDENTANNTANDPTVIESADLEIAKSVSPATATAAGQQVIYSIVVTNHGPSAATGVQVNEAIPTGLTFVSYTASQGAYNSGTGAWSVGSLPAGSDATLTLVTTAPSTLTCGGQIVNTASRSAGSPYDYDADNDSASATLTLGGIVSLSGVVTEDGTGVPLVGASVQLTDSQSRIYSTTTGAGGAYSFTSTQANPIALGSATLAVSKTGYQGSSPTVTIATCGANSLDVPLGTTNLLVTKDDEKATAAVDDVLTYAIKVQNTGTIAAENVVLVDTYRNDLLKFNSDTSNTIPGLTVAVTTNGTLTTRTYTYSPALAAGAALEFTVQMQVLTPLPAGTTSVWNKMTASTTSPEADVTNNEQQDTDTVASAPNLTISKTDGVTTVQAGQTNLVYTLSYRNDGNVAATGVTIVDTLDADVTYVSCSDTCTYDAGAHTVTWSIGELAVGGSGTRTVTVNVNTTAATGAVIGNKVVITDDGTHGTDSDPSNNTAFDSDVVARPEIVLEKTATSATAPPNWNGQVTYRLTYTNVSDLAASNVVISDPLPTGTTFVSATSPCAESSGTVTCGLGTLAAGATGAVDIIVTVQEQTSSATKTAATLTAESAAGSVITISTVGAASLRLKWTDTDPTMTEGWNANPRAVTFDDAAWGAAILGFDETHWTDASRIDAQWVATTVAGQDHGNYTFYRQKFCLPLNPTGLSGTLEVANDDYGDQYVNQVGFGTKVGAGEIVSSDISAGLQAGGNLYAVRLLNNTHGGHASYSNTDHPGLAFRITADYAGLAPFAAGPAAALAGTSLTIAADPALLGGVGPFQYMIDYGDGTAPTAFGAGASFTHTYAAGTYDALVTARDAYGCTATDSVPITVLPADRNLLANTASVGYHNGYGVSYNGAAAAGIQLLSRVDLGITKTSSPNPAYAGEPIVYTLHVTNNGSHSIGQVSLVDAMPAGVVGPSFSPDKGVYDSATHIWTGELGPTDSFDLTISGGVDPSATGTLQNTASVAPVGGTDANGANNSDSDTNTLSRRADLGVSITADKVQYAPGQSLTYTIIVTNNGSSALTSFGLNVALPAGFTATGYTPEAGSYDPDTGAWTGIQFGSVETLTLTIVGTVAAGTTGNLVATATVSTPEGVEDAVSSNNSATATVTANPTAVTLAEFSAVQQGDAVLVTWETASELHNRGFNLYRGTAAAGPDRQLNSTLIPSQSQGNPGGFAYIWEDQTDLVHGTTYFYWVEDVDIYGVATRHGPVSVDFVVPTAVTLSGLQASTGLDTLGLDTLRYSTNSYSTNAAALSWLWVMAVAGAALGVARRR
ncbi:MAG TPA: hypothetical protein VL334_21560 [Anaerolineae bacterium]|nr:hypothetical protein [Anaerolineae bacterium]